MGRRDKNQFQDYLILIRKLKNTTGSLMARDMALLSAALFFLEEFEVNHEVEIEIWTLNDLYFSGKITLEDMESYLIGRFHRVKEAV